jgi:minimal PKS chain-length factor (CLF/KS beta)
MTKAVVTGIGVVAPTGLGHSRYWAATLAGHSAIGPIERFDPAGYPVGLAGEIRDFDERELLPGRLLPQTDRVTQLSLVAAEWALADAGLDPAQLPDFSLGTVTGAASGGFEYGQRELQKLWTEGPQAVSAYMSFSWFYAVNTGQISIRHGLRGPASALVTDQAGGLDAIGHARRQLRRGTAGVLTGGVEAALCPMAVVSHLPLGQLSPRLEADRAYLPFDAAASGYVLGEGGAVLVLESAAGARRRGARGYGEIAGYAATFDPAPDRGREPGLRRAMELALEDAGLIPDDVDVVFADAAGVPHLDRAEAQALAKVFGPRAVPVTAPKAATGRLGSGAGGLDVATALLAIRDGVIPPTVNVRDVPDGYEVDLVLGTARPARIRAALVLARGIGGFNAAVVVRATGGEGNRR